MLLSTTAEKAGMKRGDVSVMLEASLFDRLMEIVKAGANAKTSSGNALLVNGFPIFKTGTSNEDREAFLKDASEKLARVHDGNPGHG